MQCFKIPIYFNKGIKNTNKNTNEKGIKKLPVKGLCFATDFPNKSKCASPME